MIQVSLLEKHLKNWEDKIIKYLKAMDRGILLMLLASLASAMVGGFTKVVTQSLPPLEVTFFRNLFGVILIGITIYKIPLKQKGGKLLLLLFRGTIGFFSLLAYFYTIAHIPLGEAVTYNKTSPIFVAIFAYIFLNEKLPKSAIFAVIVGFIGIVLIAKPDGFTLERYDLIGILSGVGAALSYTSIRELRKYYDTRAIVLSFMGIGTITPVILMVISPFINLPHLDFMFAKFIMPKEILWIYVIGIGFFATISQFFMTKAYEHTKAGIVGTIGYTNIVFALFIGIMLGDSIPDIWTIIGIASVIFAGLIVASFISS